MDNTTSLDAAIGIAVSRHDIAKQLLALPESLFNSDFAYLTIRDAIAYQVEHLAPADYGLTLDSLNLWMQNETSYNSAEVSAVKYKFRQCYTYRGKIEQRPALKEKIDRDIAAIAGQAELTAGNHDAAIQHLESAGVNPKKLDDLRRSSRRSKLPKIDVKANEIGAAELFAAGRGLDCLYITEWRAWLRWSGKVWERVSDEAIGKIIIDYCRYDLFAHVQNIRDDSARTEFAKFAARCQSANAVKNILSLSVKLRAASVDRLDADRNLLNLQNGTLDLTTFKLQPHARETYLTKICNASYLPDADAGESLDTAGKSQGTDRYNGPTTLDTLGNSGQVWQSFLASILPDEVVAWLKRAVGYSLTASIVEEKMVLMTGGGDNGKSTFVNAIRHMLGDYAMQGDQQLLTYKPAMFRGANSDSVADLIGKRFVAISETDEGDRLDEAQVKKLVSNQPVRAMRKYERAFEFRPTHMLFMDTNHPPKVRGTDHGIWKRLMVVKFGRQFSKDDIDRSLGEKLAAEADAILAWAIDGLREYRSKNNPLSEPTAMRQARQSYQAESDIVHQFVADSTARGAESNVTKDLVYQAYRRWLDKNGFNLPLTAPMFGKRLTELGWEEGRNSSSRFWRGRRLADISPTISCEPIHDVQDVRDAGDDDLPSDEDNRSF